MTPIEQLIRDTRKAVKRSGFTPYGLAVEAKLSKRSLGHMYDDHWNPTANTLRAIWRVLRKVNGTS